MEKGFDADKRIEEIKLFLLAQGIDPGDFLASFCRYREKGRRYVRLTAPHSEEALAILKKDFGGDLKALNYFPSVFSLPRELKINEKESYISRNIQGIDIGSIFAVHALDPQPGDNVLEMCAAPGTKMICISDLRGEGTGKLFANDFSQYRIQVMKSLLESFGKKDVVVLNKDARALSLKDLQEEIEKSGSENLKPLVEKEVPGRADEEGSPKNSNDFRPGKDDLTDEANQVPPKDLTLHKILVDVECTHDGSFKHLLKYITSSELSSKKPKSDPGNPISNREAKRRAKQLQSRQNKNSKEEFDCRMSDPKSYSELLSLQSSILSNGLRLLSIGGTLVYSTCSFCEAQNEKTVASCVERFNELSEAEGVKIELADLRPLLSEELKSLGFGPGSIPQTVRLYPDRSDCGAFFVAKMTKISIERFDT